MKFLKILNSILFFIYFSSPIILHSQRKVTVYHKEFCSEDVTPKKCKETAIKYAKEEALRKAGIGESIQSFRLLSSISVDNDFSQIFNKETFLELNGYIENVEFIEEPKKGFDEKLKQTFYELEIRANVKEYKSERDPLFTIDIDSLKPSYKSELKNLKIYVSPKKDCYLKIFYINNSVAEMIYPLKVSEKTKNIELTKNPDYKETLKRFKNKELIANKIFDQVNYITPYTKQEIEIGKLIFIITKEDILFDKVFEDNDGYYTKTDLNDILTWYMRIEPKSKNIVYKQFTIHR